MDIIVTDPRVVIGENQLIKGTSGAAAFDISVWPDEEVSLAPNEKYLFKTGFKMDIGTPEFAAFLFSRSGLGTKKDLNISQCVGIIDSDYQGEVMVSLRNEGPEYGPTHTITPGMRVAQMVFLNVGWTPELRLVEGFAESSARGAGGFGSTGA